MDDPIPTEGDSFINDFTDDDSATDESDEPESTLISQIGFIWDCT